MRILIKMSVLVILMFFDVLELLLQYSIMGVRGGRGGRVVLREKNSPTDRKGNKVSVSTFFLLFYFLQ